MNRVKITLAAGFMLAMAFTFNGCSNGDDDGGGGGGVPFNENSQVYYKDGTLYEGSGNIKIPIYDEDGKKILEYLNAGNVINGIAKFELPKTISNEYLEDFFGEEDNWSCTNYPKDVKVFEGGFYLTNNDGKEIGYLTNRYSDGQIFEAFTYMYFSKAGKITCNFEEPQEGRLNQTGNMDIDAKVGWNKVYVRYNWDDNYAHRATAVKFSTNNILTKELKWMLESND